MDRSHAPVFYDCEASGVEGLQIEIGWAVVNTATGYIQSEGHLVKPVAMLTRSRLLLEVETNSQMLRKRQSELEAQLLALPASSWALSSRLMASSAPSAPRSATTWPRRSPPRMACSSMP